MSSGTARRRSYANGVSFGQPDDPDYLCAKRIKRGQSRVDPVYDDFLERFRARYGFAPLAVMLDEFKRPTAQGEVHRLGVVLERSEQCSLFLSSPTSFDPRRQRAVANLLTESLRGADSQKMLGLDRSQPGAGVRSSEILVRFLDFERVAIREVHDLAEASGREDFAASLGLRDQFWCTQRLSGPPTVFVYTDEQARALAASARPEQWADHYFEIASRYDEFAYLRRADIVIRIDSKENFEAHYSGNWYHYFK
jgi:hypothetical protein